MIHWTLLIAAFVIGEIVGLAIAAICVGCSKEKGKYIK